jgi:hypothetical protein
VSELKQIVLMLRGTPPDAGGDHSDRSGGEPIDGTACDLQTMDDVVADFAAVQRFQAGNCAKTLPNLLAIRLFESFGEARLAGQDKLHQLSSGRFEVRQHADGFEGVAVQILGFIQYDDNGSSGALGFDQVLVEQLVAGGGGRTRLLTEGSEDGVQDRGAVVIRVGQVGDLGAAFQHLNQRVEHGSFAQAGAAEGQSEAATLLDGIEKCRHSFAVLRGLIEEEAVGRDTEWLFVEAEVGVIHG